MVDEWFLGDFFWKVEWNSAHTCESHAAHVWQLMCTVITKWWRGALKCGSCVAINMYHNYYYMLEGSPHVWQLMCMVITTIWWRGPLTCGNYHAW